MRASTTVSERSWGLRLVLWSVCLVCMTVVTVINFTTGSALWGLVSLACIVALAVALPVALVRRRRGT